MQHNKNFHLTLPACVQVGFCGIEINYQGAKDLPFAVLVFHDLRGSALILGRQRRPMQVCCGITTSAVFINSVMGMSWKRWEISCIWKTYGVSEENTSSMQEKVVCQFLRWIPSWTPKYMIIPSFVSFAWLSPFLLLPRHAASLHSHSSTMLSIFPVKEGGVRGESPMPG